MPVADSNDAFPTLKLADIPDLSLNDLITEENRTQTSAVLGGAVAGAVADAAAGVVADAASNVVKDVAGSVFNLKLEELPVHIDDFVDMWYQGLADAGTKYRITMYNACLQVLKELETGQLELPEIDNQTIDGKELANDIKHKILQQFIQNGVDINIESNLKHRAFFAHCTQRVLENLKNGIFSGTDGFTGQKPEIADIINNRINEIFTQETLGV